MTALRPDTQAVHAGDEPDPATGALDAPVVLSSAFAFASADTAAAVFRGEQDGWVYSRWRNPTVEAFERKIAALEGAEDAAAFGSGMAAIHAVLGGLTSAGDHIVSASRIYAETAVLLRGPLARTGVEVTFVDPADPAEVASALRPETRLVHLETPANPTLAITDLAAVTTALGDHPATVAVDSTFATPYHQQPLRHGAHLVIHSATKGLCGHGDAVGGVVAGAERQVAEIRRLGVRTYGGALAPLSAMLLSRGVRTLSVRMARASANALTLAQRLHEDPRVERVHYPGLPDHAGHDAARRQMTRGFGALVAFEVRGGRDAGARLYDTVGLIHRAVSLGDVRSLLTHPASTTHASWTAEQRAAAGIGEGLLRLSVGIEDVEDLWEDLDQHLPG